MSDFIDPHEQIRALEIGAKEAYSQAGAPTEPDHAHYHRAHAHHHGQPMHDPRNGASRAQSVNENSEKIFALLHDQMMELANKRVHDKSVGFEADQLALDLLIRAELPLYIRVHAHIVLACGNHENFLHHANEAVRCVKKGRVIFGRGANPEARLAVEGLMEEAQEAQRRAERDATQLERIKRSWKKEPWEEKEGQAILYGGNSTDVEDKGDETEDEIFVRPRLESDDDGSEEEVPEEEVPGEEVPEEANVQIADVEPVADDGTNPVSDDGTNLVGADVNPVGADDEVNPVGDDEGDAAGDDLQAVPPKLRRSKRTNIYGKNYKTGEMRR